MPHFEEGFPCFRTSLRLSRVFHGFGPRSPSPELFFTGILAQERPGPYVCIHMCVYIYICTYDHMYICI